VRRRLTRNLLVAALIIGLGLSYPFLPAFFQLLDSLGITHRLAQTSIHTCLFLVYPVYLMGQTIPLVAYCSTGGDLPRSTGLMLFLSTIGSFLGSVVSTLVFMTHLGVHATVALTLVLVVLLAAVVGWRTEHRKRTIAGAAALGACLVALNNPLAQGAYGIVSSNLYSDVRIVADPAEGSRVLVINNSASSKVVAKPEQRFRYVRFIEDEVIGKPDPDRPRRILVIGAGGFTIGLEDGVNSYTYIDIDPSLLDVSVEHFLRQPLSSNKTFVAESARSFLRRNDKTYDVVVLDAYTNRNSIPADLVTREAFAAVRQAVTPEGRVVMNIIASPTFADAFSRSIDATIRSVFPFVTRQVLTTRSHGRDNVMYVADRPKDGPKDIYTDDRNRSFLDN
jgi:spermidine synthase